MKIFVALLLVQFSVLVHPRKLEHTHHAGSKGADDILLYSHPYTSSGSLGSDRVNVEFPPKCLWRLKPFYTVTALMVKDYNPYLSTVYIRRGGIGQHELDIEVESASFRQIDVTVEYYGKFDVEKFLKTPQKSCGYKPPYTG